MNREQRRKTSRVRRAALSLLVAGTLVAGNMPAIGVSAAPGSGDDVAIAGDLAIQGGGGGGNGSTGGGGGGGGYVEFTLSDGTQIFFGGGGDGRMASTITDGAGAAGGGGSIGGGGGGNTLHSGGASGSFMGGLGGRDGEPPNTREARAGHGGYGNPGSDPAIPNATGRIGAGRPVGIEANGTIGSPAFADIETAQGTAGSNINGGIGGNATVTATDDVILNSLTIFGGQHGALSATGSWTNGHGGAATFNAASHKVDVKTITLGYDYTVQGGGDQRSNDRQGLATLNAGTLVVRDGYQLNIDGGRAPNVTIGMYEFDLTGVSDGGTLLTVNGGAFPNNALPTDPANIEFTGENSLDVGDTITLISNVSGAITPFHMPLEGDHIMQFAVVGGDLVGLVAENQFHALAINPGAINVSGSPAGEYVEGMPISVTAASSGAGNFTGWTIEGAEITGGNTANPATFLMPANPVTLTANYDPVPFDINLDDSNPPTNGVGWTFSENRYIIDSDANVVIVGTSANQRRIEVAEGATNVRITLHNVTIAGLGNAQTPLLINSGAEATVTLVGENNLTANNNGAGLQLIRRDHNASTTATVTINGDGTLNARGANDWPGIGGQYGRGVVIIESGIINATGGNSAAGIGGSHANAGGNVTINGGTVTATQGSDSAGIGGGRNTAGGNVTITGGTVITTGGNTSDNARGISGTLTMTNANGGGVVFANSVQDMTGVAERRTGGILVIRDGAANAGTHWYGANSFTLNQNITVPAGYTLTVPGHTPGPVRMLTIPQGVTLTNNGTVIPANGSTINVLGAVAGNKINGSRTSPPTLDPSSPRTHSSVTFNVQGHLSGTNQTFEFGHSLTRDGEITWNGVLPWPATQHRIIRGLEPDTEYYFFARSAESAHFAAGEPAAYIGPGGSTVNPIPIKTLPCPNPDCSNVPGLTHSFAECSACWSCENGFISGGHPVLYECEPGHWQCSVGFNADHHTTYTITDSVANGAISNIATDPRRCLPWSGTLTPSVGYVRPASITVMMNGYTDITNSVTYDSTTGLITIPENIVTVGNVVISGGTLQCASHSWTDNDCTHVDGCTECGYRHTSHDSNNAQAANCEVPNQCTRCESIIDEAKTHSPKAEDCTKCQNCTITAIPGAAHNFNWNMQNQGPSGHDFQCEDCDVRGGLTQHSPGNQGAVDANCTEALVCACGYEMKAGNPSHSPRAINCTQCYDCSATLGRTCDPSSPCVFHASENPCEAGHDSDHAGNCVTPSRCTRCGTVMQEALGHNFTDDWSVAIPATCHSDGTESRTCTRNCGLAGHTETRPVTTRPNHSWGPWGGNTATCTAAGTETRSCTVAECTATDSQATAALDHDWSDWAVTTPATATTAGVETRTCNRSGCNVDETRAIPATGNNNQGNEQGNNQGNNNNNQGNGGGNYSFTLLSSSGEWTGSGTAYWKIDANHEGFYRLLWNGQGLERDVDYAITQGSTVITLSESHLATLPDGSHAYTAEFADGTKVELELEVSGQHEVPTADGPGPNRPVTDRPALPSDSGVRKSPRTGEGSHVRFWFLPMVASAIGIVIMGTPLWRKRKDSKN